MDRAKAEPVRLGSPLPVRGSRLAVETLDHEIWLQIPTT
jgi:hypothetical protein